MRMLIGVVAFVVLVVWSLLAAGAWALVDGPGDAVVDGLAGLFGDQGARDTAGWLLGIVQSLGLGLVGVVWFLGAAGILIAAALFRRVVRR